MGWTKNTKDTELNNQYYMMNGTSTIAKISIGDKIIYELHYKQKQYTQFASSKEAIAKFKELESQA